MKDRFDDVWLIPDVNITGHEDSLLNLPKIKKIAAIAMISTLGFVGINSGNYDDNSGRNKIDRQDTDLVDYNPVSYTHLTLPTIYSV